MSKNRQHKKTRNWAARQNKDQYVQQARASGYRARAVYKLKQINDKFKLITPGSLVVDLGAAPGSWSQYVSTIVEGEDQIVSVDLLPMEPVKKVTFIKGDFTDEVVVEQIRAILNNRELDLVLSDMAPNISGIRATDQARAQELQDMMLTFCERSLKRGGSLVTKLFEGEAVSATRKKLDLQFSRVQMVKPDASRSESKEIFVLARGYRR